MRFWLRSMTIIILIIYAPDEALVEEYDNIILIIYAPDEALVEEYDNNNTNNLCT